MKALLLTRHSEFQMYCANQLWKRRRVAGVILENGFSFHRSSGFSGSARLVYANASLLLPVVLRSPGLIADYVRVAARKDLYFGGQERHHERVLRSDYRSFAADLPLFEVPDINAHEVSVILRRESPDIVLVFGTALIRPELFAAVPVPWVNLHWGWSPDYRGDGIVPALAREGPAGLGLTVHLLSERIDGGDILYRARPAVDPDDNFYSIGLKLTRLGVELFDRVLDDFDRSGTLVGQPQDLSRGRVYGSRYMKSHPRLYHQAWRRLREATASPQEAQA